MSVKEVGTNVNQKNTKNMPIRLIKPWCTINLL